MALATHAGRSGRLFRDLRVSVGAWLATGAAIGLTVAAVAVRMNPSLRDPADAMMVVLVVAGVYAVLFVPVGVAACLLLQGFVARGGTPVREVKSLPQRAPQRTLRLDETSIVPAEEAEETEEDPEGRPGSTLPAEFSVHAVCALFVFVTYVVAQRIAGAVWAGDESSALRLGASGVLVVVGLVAAGWAVTRPRVATAAREYPWTVPTVVIFISGVMLLMGLGGGEFVPAPAETDDDQAAHEELAVLSSDQALRDGRVILLGLDGADWGRIEPLLEEGRLPSFRRLVDGGLHAPLATSTPTRSPLLWNTIATGVDERSHGVVDWTEVKLPGFRRGLQRSYAKPLCPELLPKGVGLLALLHPCIDNGWFPEVPVTSFQRRAKAVWNILGDHGLKVGVVRWPASWPAEDLNGFVVADDDPWSRTYVAQRDGRPYTSYAGVVSPPSLMASLERHLWDAREQQPASTAISLPIFDGLTVEERKDLARRQRLLGTVGLLYGSDRFAARAGLHLWTQERLDFLAVRLRLVDAVSQGLAQRTGVVDRAYEELDELIGPFLDAADENTTIVVVSEHGWSYEAGSRGYDHAPPGIFVLWGAAGRRGGGWQGTPSVLDVAPTVLALFGLPASAEMPGQPVFQALAMDYRNLADLPRPDDHGPYRPSFEEPEEGWGAGGSDRAAHVELLRSLGYL